MYAYSSLSKGHYITLATRMAGNAGAAPLPLRAAKVKEFDPRQQHWPAYEERLTQYFVANGVTGVEVEGGSDTMKVAIFLTTIGPKTYGILRDLVAQAKPAEK